MNRVAVLPRLAACAHTTDLAAVSKALPLCKWAAALGAGGMLPVKEPINRTAVIELTHII